MKNRSTLLASLLLILSFTLSNPLLAIGPRKTGTRIDTDTEGGKSGGDDATDTGDDTSTDEEKDGGGKDGETYYSYFFTWRGFKLNPDKKGSHHRLANYISDHHGDAHTVLSTSEINAKGNAILDIGMVGDDSEADYANEEDDKYIWDTKVTGVGYNYGHIDIVADLSTTIHLSNESSDTAYGTPIYAPDEFVTWFHSLTNWSKVYSDYKFYIALRGFDVSCNDYSYQPESFYVYAYLRNDEHAFDEDDDNDNDHYVGNDGYLRPFVFVEFTEPDENPDNCNITVKYDVIGFKVADIDAKFFTYEDATSGDGSLDNPKKQTLNLNASLSSKNQAFIILLSNGFQVDDMTDTDENNNWKWDGMYTSASISEVNGSSLTVSMSGAYKQSLAHSLIPDESATRRPNKLKGYVIYAKTSGVLISEEAEVEQTEPGDNADDTSHSDSGTVSVTISEP